MYTLIGCLNLKSSQRCLLAVLQILQTMWDDQEFNRRDAKGAENWLGKLSDLCGEFQATV